MTEKKNRTKIIIIGSNDEIIIYLLTTGYWLGSKKFSFDSIKSNYIIMIMFIHFFFLTLVLM